MGGERRGERKGLKHVDRGEEAGLGPQASTKMGLE